MTRFAASVASFVSVLAFAGSAFAFSAPQPTKAQEKQVTAQIQRNVQRTAWFKQFKAGGQNPTVAVTFGSQAQASGAIGGGFPIATATVSAGKSMFGTGENPQKQRQFTVMERPNGQFVATGGKWNQLMLAHGANTK